MIFKKILIFILIIATFYGFYKMGAINYNKHLEISKNYINHPEGIPTPEVAKNTAFGYSNVKADIYWLETVQYIGSNALSSKYKKYLYGIIDIVTELNPYFEHPYVIGELLLPNYNSRYEKLNKEERNNYTNQAIEIGEKGIKNFCDADKIKAIKNEFDLDKIKSNPKYKNACKGFLIPYHLGFIYYQYKKDPIMSSYYYRIASSNDDAVSGAEVMAAIMQGKGGNREKSFFMFLAMADTDTSNKICTEFNNTLKDHGNRIFTEKSLELNGKYLEFLSNTREKAFGKFKDSNNALEGECINNVNKAIRELNLAYIEVANEKFKVDNHGQGPRNAKVLYNKGYMDYLPIDYQQYTDEKGNLTQGIEYIYDYDTGWFDYDMVSY